MVMAEVGSHTPPDGILEGWSRSLRSAHFRIPAKMSDEPEILG